MQRIQLNLPDGTVEGTAQDGIRRFYSLPYAAPMTEERRFRAPEPVERWEGVRDATLPGPRAPQNPTPPIDIDVDALMGKPGPEGGDYLTSMSMRRRAPTRRGRLWCSFMAEASWPAARMRPSMTAARLRAMAWCAW